LQTLAQRVAHVVQDLFRPKTAHRSDR
jgi:hypothetical protein